MKRLKLQFFHKDQMPLAFLKKKVPAGRIVLAADIGGTKTNASQCTGKTKSGSRCKRRTKNTNGRCYQH